MDSKVRVTALITVLLNGPVDVGNTFIGRQGVIQMILVMANSESYLEQVCGTDHETNSETTFVTFLIYLHPASGYGSNCGCCFKEGQSKEHYQRWHQYFETTLSVQK